MDSKKKRQKKKGLKPNNYSFKADDNSAELSESYQDDASYQREDQPGDRVRVDGRRATDVNQYDMSNMPDPQPNPLILSDQSEEHKSDENQHADTFAQRCRKQSSIYQKHLSKRDILKESDENLTNNLSQKGSTQRNSKKKKGQKQSKQASLKKLENKTISYKCGVDSAKDPQRIVKQSELFEKRIADKNQSCQNINTILSIGRRQESESESLTQNSNLAEYILKQNEFNQNFHSPRTPKEEVKSACQQPKQLMGLQRNKTLKRCKTTFNDEESSPNSKMKSHSQKSLKLKKRVLTPDSYQRSKTLFFDENSPSDVQVNYQEFVQELQKEMKDLKSQAHRSKLFLNMVVHDMRNPTKSIKMGLQTTISKLRDFNQINEDQKAFDEKCLKLQNKIDKIQPSQSQESQNLQNYMGQRVQLLLEQVENNFKSSSQEQELMASESQSISEQIKLLLDELKQPYVDPPILDESFEDFDQDMIDECFEQVNEQEDQIVQNQGNSYASNIKKLEHLNGGGTANDSHLWKDKKIKLQTALRDLLSRFPNGLNRNDELIENFIDQYYFGAESMSHQIQFLNQKPQSVDFCQQVDFDFNTRFLASKVDSIKSKIEALQESTLKIKEQLDCQKDSSVQQKNMISHQLQTLAQQNQEDLKLFSIQNRKQEIKAEFYKECFKTINLKANEAQKILQQQMFSQQMMENLINDLLDLAKMQNNSFQLTNDYFSLSSVIFEAFQMLMHSASEKGIQLKAEIDEKANLELIEGLLGDQNRILQILLNFLSNSLKFTDRGGSINVRIEILTKQNIRRHDKKPGKLGLETYSSMALNRVVSQNILQMSKEDNGEQDNLINETIKQEYLENVKNQNEESGQEKYLEIKISVIDTGVGISKEGIKKLFIDFGKLEENQTRNRQGTGLGLSICKQIIEQMGGSVDVKSELGKGTQFKINIKTKCKVQEVKFNQSEILDSCEDQFDMAYNRYIKKGIHKKYYYKFIEKTHEAMSLHSTVIEQIHRNRAKENESQIQQMAKLQQNTRKTQSSFTKEIKKLMNEVNSVKVLRALSSEQLNNQIRQHDSYLPESMDGSQTSLSDVNEDSLLNMQNQGTSLIESQPEQTQQEQICSFSSPQKQNSSKQCTAKKVHPMSKMKEISQFSFKYANPVKAEEEKKQSKRDADSGSDEKSHSECSESQQSQKSSHISTKKPMKCLIANDEPMQLYMLQVIFQMNGFDVTVAQNGHEAYEQVVNSFRKLHDNTAADLEKQLFDLIILDLNMPISDGYQACKNIVNLYNDSNKIFKTTRNQNVDEQVGQIISEQIDLGSSNLPFKDQMPLILAVTSEILSDELQQALSELGFANAYEAPIKDAIIKSEILPELEERRIQLLEKFNLMNVIQGSVGVLDQESDDEIGPMPGNVLNKSLSVMSISKILQSRSKNSNKEVNMIQKQSSLQVGSQQRNQQIKKRISLGRDQVIRENSAEKHADIVNMKTPTFNCDKIRPIQIMLGNQPSSIVQSIEGYKNSQNSNSISSSNRPQSLPGLPRFAEENKQEDRQDDSSDGITFKAKEIDRASIEEGVRDNGLSELGHHEIDDSESVSSGSLSSHSREVAQRHSSECPTVQQVDGPQQEQLDNNGSHNICENQIGMYLGEESKQNQDQMHQNPRAQEDIEQIQQNQQSVNRMITFGHFQNQRVPSQQHPNSEINQQDASPPQVVQQPPSSNEQYENSEQSDPRRNHHRQEN